jgi:hypothetical protein
MSQRPESDSAQTKNLAQAKQLLSEAIEILSANGSDISAAHAQLALDMANAESSRLDPKLPD